MVDLTLARELVSVRTGSRSSLPSGRKVRRTHLWSTRHSRSSCNRRVCRRFVARGGTKKLPAAITSLLVVLTEPNHAQHHLDLLLEVWELAGELEHVLDILVIWTPHANKGPDPLHVFTGGAGADESVDPGDAERPEVIEENHVLNAQCPFARRSSWGFTSALKARQEALATGVHQSSNWLLLASA